MNRFKYILATISSQTEVDVDCFKKFCLQTAKQYVKKYDWYYMSNSVDILLIHSYKMINQFHGKSSGDKSEEPLETSHSIMKYYRRENARKTSR